MKSTLATGNDVKHIDRQRPINVLYVIGSLPLGGAESHVVTLASALNGPRYRVHVCCLRSEGAQAAALRARGIPVFSLHMRLRHWPIGVYRLYRLILRLRPQIVHTHLLEADRWGRLMARLVGVPVIMSTLHGRFYWRQRGLWRLFARYLDHFTDRIIAVSEEIRVSFVRQQGISGKNIIAIPNAVDVERFQCVNSRNEQRSQLGVDRSSPLIGTVARLVPEKRLDHFLQAARLVSQAAPAARFVIVGDGPVRDDLGCQAAQLGLAPEVLTFLGSRLDVPQLLSAMDVFVLSSETEGLPVSMLEAMAAGKAVVATRVGGVPQIIDHGRNGILVPPADPTSLAHAILTLIEDSTLRELLAREGYRTVEACYSTKVVRQQIITLYEHLLETKGEGRDR